MVKQAVNLETIVSRQYADENYNVFYSNSLLKGRNKPGEKLVFLYSEKYVVPVTISRRSIFNYAHICVEPAVVKDGEETLKTFLDDVCIYLRDVVKVQWINQTSAASFFMDYPMGSKHIPFGSHVIDLSLSEEDLWKNVHSKHRNVIKKAEKDGVVIECGRTQKLVEDYHNIDIDTWNRSNRVAATENHWKNLMEKMGDNCVIYIAYLDGEPQSGAFLYYNMQMCYYMYGANKNNPHIGSGNLLQWKAILDMKERGIKKYSFVGCRINEDENSKYHGIQRFKERFGGELIQGYMFKIDFNPLMRKLFNMAVTLRDFMSTHRLVPFSDVIDQEIHKWPQE